MKTKVLLSSLLVVVLLSGCGSSKNDLLTNPKDSDVKAAIETIEGVKEICMATEDHDPNGKLNKEGGYTGAVYFRLSDVGDDELANPSDSVCDIGTEGGGQIEIYKTEKDAKKRNDYLSNFDATVLASSHVVVGTNIIRLSDKLTASQQKTLEEKITAVLSEEK